MSAIQHLVVMGVSGSGKTTVAEILARRLGWPCADADDFHPDANIEKMSQGIPLTDEDRWPWLQAVRNWLTDQARAGRSSVVTCSALKVVYRDVLREAEGRVRFVHLAGSTELIGERMRERSSHFMPADLLPSQVETLEPLTPDEDGVAVDITPTPEAIADTALRALAMDALAMPSREAGC